MKQKHGRAKRGELLESTGKAKGLTTLAEGRPTAGETGAQTVRVKALHHQA